MGSAPVDVRCHLHQTLPALSVHCCLDQFLERRLVPFGGIVQPFPKRYSPTFALSILPNTSSLIHSPEHQLLNPFSRTSAPQSFCCCAFYIMCPNSLSFLPISFCMFLFQFYLTV